VCIEGDGTPYRSYLYAADLAIWLWAILFRGASGRPYNVGSERGVTISELARAVAAEIQPQASIEVAGVPRPGAPPQRYVPSTRLARAELGLEEWISLEESIRRTAAWNQAVAVPSGGIV
jgi:dTDP-glucose 4,6-dehydratase